MVWTFAPSKGNYTNLFYNVTDDLFLVVRVYHTVFSWHADAIARVLVMLKLVTHL